MWYFPPRILGVFSVLLSAAWGALYGVSSYPAVKKDCMDGKLCAYTKTDCHDIAMAYAIVMGIVVWLVSFTLCILWRASADGVLHVCGCTLHYVLWPVLFCCVIKFSNSDRSIRIYLRGDLSVCMWVVDFGVDRVVSAGIFFVHPAVHCGHCFHVFCDGQSQRCRDKTSLSCHFRHHFGKHER